MKIEEQKKLLTMKRTTRGQLRKGDRRLWEGLQSMKKKLIGGPARWEEMAQHIETLSFSLGRKWDAWVVEG